MPVTLHNKMRGKTKSGLVLTAKQEKFCQVYVAEFGNGCAAARAAYGRKGKPMNTNCASSISTENLQKPAIKERIRELLDSGPLSEEAVDSELIKIIQQDHDLPSKRGGVDIYNKLKGRYKDDGKTEININARFSLADLHKQALSKGSEVIDVTPDKGKEILTPLIESNELENVGKAAKSPEKDQNDDNSGNSDKRLKRVF